MTSAGHEHFKPQQTWTDFLPSVLMGRVKRGEEEGEKGKKGS